MSGKAATLALLLLPAAGLAGCLHEDNAWALRATGLEPLLERGLTGSSVRVALLDTGIDLDTPSLRHLDDGDPFNGELVAYADFVGEEGGPRDRNGHGTFVAGVLAGDHASGLGRLRGPVVPGAAPHVQLLVGRVNADDQGSLRALAHALAWALDEGADVISLSLGVSEGALRAQPETAQVLRGLLARAEREGALVVAAAGNTGLVLFPADQPTVLAVGAVDRRLDPLQPASRGKPDLYAPGRGVTGPGTGGSLVGMDGTSAAVPFVAAAAALLISAGADPHDAPGVERLRGALRDGALPVGPGAVLLQADRSLDLYVPH